MPDQKQEQALAYARRGWAVHPLKEGTKNQPLTKWTEAATTDPDQIREWWTTWPDAGIAIATGEVSGGLVVLDVDNKNGKHGSASLRELAGDKEPDTLKVCTPSGGFHFYFVCDQPITGHTDINGFSGLDTRGQGGYVVAPPSVVDGKQYRSDDPEKSVAEAPEWFIEVWRQHKNRRTGTRKPAGLFREERSIVLPETIAEGRRTSELVSYIGKLVDRGEDAETVEDKVRTANATLCTQPLAEDELVGQVLPAIGRFIDRRPETGTEILHHLNGRHAVLQINGKVRILDDRGDGEVTFLSVADFNTLHANLPRVDGVAGGQIPATRYWLEHPLRRGYDKVDFLPGETSDPRIYNLWKGLAVEPVPGDCSLYLAHIRDVVCSGDEDLYHYVIAWMADAVQNPGRKPGISIVLRGKQGTGKGRYVEHFGALFGPHYVRVTQPRQLTGNFNAHMKHALLVFADEAFWAGDRSAEGPLKALITEEYQMIEPKGVDPFMVRNNVRLICATNNDWAVPAGLDDRRFLVLDVSDSRQSDHGYFAELEKKMRNGGREALMDYLLNYDLEGVNLRAVPKTRALLDQKLRTMGSFDRFWFEALKDGQIVIGEDIHSWEFGDLTIPIDDFYIAYTSDVRNQGYRHPETKEAVGKRLKDLFGSGFKRSRGRAKHGSRPYQYEFPCLPVCREQFEEEMGQSIDWEGDC